MVSLEILKLLRNFLRFQKQLVVLNVVYSSLDNVNAIVPQDSILGLLIFLICIKDLSYGRLQVVKFLTTILFFFSVVNYIQTSATTLTNDLTAISNRASQW